jgi:hypothetical protein
MPDVTVSSLSVGQESYFTFKEPVNFYIKNKFNLNELTVKLKVVSIISMKDTIRNDLRDPYTDFYIPAGISEVEYKKDLVDNVPMISLTYIDTRNVERFIRCPLNYIDSVASITNIPYQNKLILIDLNRLPVDTNVTELFSDLSDYIESRIGITPALKEVSVGNTEMVDHLEHETRETIRGNMVTVHKTLHTQLEEITLKHTELLNRLQVLGITLN